MPPRNMVHTVEPMITWWMGSIFEQSLSGWMVHKGLTAAKKEDRKNLRSQTETTSADAIW